MVLVVVWGRLTIRNLTAVRLSIELLRGDTVACISPDLLCEKDLKLNGAQNRLLVSDCKPVRDSARHEKEVVVQQDAKCGQNKEKLKGWAAGFSPHMIGFCMELVALSDYPANQYA